jgi:hypothetical protein
MKEGSSEVWEEGYIYLVKNVQPSVEAQEKLVSMDDAFL